MVQPSIELSNVYKSIKKRNYSLDVLEDIQLSVHQGEFVTIMGRSGAGKSTLLNLIGLLDVPDRGEIKVIGRSFSDIRLDDVAEFKKRHIGYIFQNYNLFKKLTVRENLKLPFYLDSEVCLKEIENEAYELLERFHLKDKIDETVGFLSGGEQQRVALIRCILSHPQIILADEPTGSIDSVNENEFIKLLKSLVNTTIIVVTHNDKYKAFSDVVYYLEDKKLIKG